MTDIVFQTLIKSQDSSYGIHERSIQKVNPYVSLNMTRHPKTIDKNIEISSSIAANYNTTVRYDLNQHTGFARGDSIILKHTFGITTSANDTSYVDGFGLYVIDYIAFKTQNKTLFNLTAEDVFQYYQRLDNDYKNYLFSLCFIGNPDLSITLPAQSNTAYVLIPTFWNKKHLLQLNNCDRPYIEVKYKSLQSIAYDSGAASVSGSITDNKLNMRYISFLDVDKSQILMNIASHTISPYFDGTESALTAGSTTASCDLPFSGLIHYISFYIEDSGTTYNPFTAIAITSASVSIDNKNYPENTIDNTIEIINQSQYFKRVFTNNINTIRFNSFDSEDHADDDDEHISHGGIIFKRISNPKLNLTFPALSNNSVIHIFAYGSCIIVNDKENKSIDLIIPN